jgi:Di-haem cytochrome c peroxidase
MDLPIIWLPVRGERDRPIFDPTPRPRSRGAGPIARAGLMAVSLTLAGAQAQAWEDKSGESSLRDYISDQVGGLDNLQVPARNEDLPLPRAADGTVPYRYEYTEVKRYLGKLLFHDPIRTERIDINKGQPKNLPKGTSFGGTFNATDPLIQEIFPETSNPTSSDIQNIVAATKATGSCGSCHLGEAGAGKAGQQLNFNVGGEGRGYTDEDGNFIARRRPQSILVPLRTEALFPGDVLVDALPTLTDIWVDHGTNVITTPAYFYHYPNPPGALNTDAATADSKLKLLATGRLDQLDSVARMSPSMVGFAFNNRLLLGGFAGEPQSTPGSLNPFMDPAQENLTLLLIDAHRMLNFQAPVLRTIPAFVQLFREAFPQEAAADPGDLTTLVTDDTYLRAVATFLRTVVSRNTPFDAFLAGHDEALSHAQKRGARLFFTPATAGGAGCFGCHSGPMLNKQSNDPDVTGVGTFVEENFINVGIGDHPVQALTALARGHLDPAKLGNDGFPYHAEDNGREEVTHDQSDAFKFRALTPRQLKDGRNFMHNASFTNVRDVVKYFNAGVPQDPTAAAQPTLSPRFTNPRGAGSRGLGLSERQVDDLTDFLENALYDPALVHYDPNSTTDTLQPNERDITYSKYHPDLVAAAAAAGQILKDGLMPSGEAIDNNDPLTRQDEGLAFLDVTHWASINTVSSDTNGGLQSDVYRIENSSNSIIDTNLLVVAEGLPGGVQLIGPHTGVTSTGAPYLRVYLTNGVLNPGDSTVQTLQFKLPQGSTRLSYSLDLLSGQGNPYLPIPRLVRVSRDNPPAF